MQALLRGQSRNRYERTGRGQNQVSSPNKHQIRAGIRQTGNREQADNQGTETLEYKETGTRLGNAVRHIQTILSPEQRENSGLNQGRSI
jgi:hypothetical protein